MSDDEYNDFEMSNNNSKLPSTNKKRKTMKKMTIDDIDGKEMKNVKITSPRSKAAMIKLGYVDKDLNYITFKEFIEQNPNLIGAKKEIKKNRYEYLENLRKERIKEIKELREKIDPNELSSQYSLIKKNNSSKIKNEESDSKFKSTAIENQKKEIQRLKNKNEMELIGMVEYELKRELMKKQAEEKIKKENEKMEKYQKALMKQRRKEEKLKRKKEEEAEKKQKELEEYQRKLDNERYMEEIRKAKEEEKEEKKR